jgi:hypothetical protein
VSDHVPDLDLRGHFAFGPWRVRRTGYGAMQLASDGVFGAAPESRSGAILPAAQVLPDPGLVVPIVPSMLVQLAVRARASG